MYRNLGKEIKIQVEGLELGLRRPFKLEDFIKMENELDLLTVKSYCEFREERVMHGEEACSDPRPACFLTLVGFARTSVCQLREAQERLTDTVEEHH